ncbi:hypothetical protein F5Y02DRAFT_128271 [Annulohypoxylon stygium]|nr:hypothetical protein F5Y02DRAFT_128271 [Annulohypoxylon stygium]
MLPHIPTSIMISRLIYIFSLHWIIAAVAFPRVPAIHRTNRRQIFPSASSSDLLFLAEAAPSKTKSILPRNPASVHQSSSISHANTFTNKLLPSAANNFGTVATMINRTSLSCICHTQGTTPNFTESSLSLQRIPATSLSDKTISSTSYLSYHTPGSTSSTTALASSQPSSQLPMPRTSTVTDWVQKA